MGRGGAGWNAIMIKQVIRLLVNISRRAQANLLLNLASQLLSPLPCETGYTRWEDNPNSNRAKHDYTINTFMDLSRKYAGKQGALECVASIRYGRHGSALRTSLKSSPTTHNTNAKHAPSAPLVPFTPTPPLAGPSSFTPSLPTPHPYPSPPLAPPPPTLTSGSCRPAENS